MQCQAEGDVRDILGMNQTYNRQVVSICSDRHIASDTRAEDKDVRGPAIRSQAAKVTVWWYSAGT